jgi:hypothetical protein
MVQKGRVLENMEILKHRVWDRREKGVVLAIENHKLYFDIPHILIVVLKIFQQNMGF